MRRNLLISVFCIFFSIAARAQKDSLRQEKVYVSVQVIPSFPGGLEALFKFLDKNISYPAAARKNHTEGKVIVSFIVERNGQLADVKVSRAIGDGCDEEAVRVVKLSAPWKPGTQGGKPVRVAYMIPVEFSLTN